jgi:predicted nucleotide-binding protein
MMDMPLLQKRILFQGTFVPEGRRSDAAQQLDRARPLAAALGDFLIRGGFELILTGSKHVIDEELGIAAVKACEALNVEPHTRIRTYLDKTHRAKRSSGFGMVLDPLEQDWNDVRTFVVQEADAVVALLGGDGTHDSIQRALLAKKPVFPIAVAGGGAERAWERLKLRRYCNRITGDIDFLGDHSLSAETLASRIVKECETLLKPATPHFSRRIFIVHGHDASGKNELARLLQKLDFEPVILHEQPDRGRTVIEKLSAELADIGFCFVLFTPDDLVWSASDSEELRRARQNVVFEHGLLIGLLGRDRVCAILKGNVERPSDLQGVIFKTLSLNERMDSIAAELIRELKTADYEVDANRIV